MRQCGHLQDAVEAGLDLRFWRDLGLGLEKPLFLREGPAGEGFRKSPERVQHRIAEKKVRGQLGRGLPSFAGLLPSLGDFVETDLALLG